MDSFNAAMNAKYGRFYVQRFSEAQGRYISLKPGYRTIEEALAAAKRADKRNPYGKFHFVDVVA